MVNSYKLNIIARASDESASSKMTKAGANRVVSPFRAGALTMAQLMDTQNLENFMELFVEGDDHADLSIIKINKNSPYCNKPISQLGFENQGVTIAAIRQKGNLKLRPNGRVIISPDDNLVCIGPASALNSIANT